MQVTGGSPGRLPGVEDETPICSAKDCRQPARHVLVWNNPKVHTADREKTWVACDAHRQSLGDYLDVRGFLKRIDPLTDASTAGPEGGSSTGPGHTE